MKKDLKLTKLMLFASTGALITASLVYSQDASERQSEQQSQQSQSYQSESQSLEIKTEEQAQGAEISEPAGAERPSSRQQFSSQSSSQAANFGSLERASDLIGMEVESQQGEKLGDIKDMMIDLQSGRIPFAVLSSGGVLGLGDRLLAIPPTALQSQDDAFVLSMDQNQLKNAPTFGRNEWPQRMDQQWSANVYQFYGQQPYWQTTGSSEIRTRSQYQQGSITEPSGAEFRHEMQGPSVEVYEPAGAPVYYEKKRVTRYGKTFVGDNNTMDDINLGSGTRGGAEDLQDFDEKANSSKDAISEYHASHRGIYDSRGTAYGPGYEAHIVEPSAAGRGDWQRGGHTTTTTTRQQQHYSSQQQYQSPGTQTVRSSQFSSGGTLHRASDLIGLNVKDSQNKTIGEIKDVVIDMNSGHVAFVAFEGSGALDVDDQWIAVPPSAFRSMGASDKHVTLNIGADRLRNAPTFEEGSWEEATGEEFVSRVYSHYGQQPYWRSGSSIQEPSGTQPQSEQQYQKEEQFKQEETDTSIESQQLEEPSGAEAPDLNQPSELENKDSEAPERELSDPAGSEIESSTESTQSSATLEQEESVAAPSAGVDVSAESSSTSAGTEGQAGVSISEQAGAESSTQSTESALSSESSASASSVESEAEAQAQVTEPAGAEAQVSSSEQSTDLESQQSQDVSESAGAATSADQTGSANLIENVRTQLRQDTASGAQNIQVSAEQGKIVLKGTVNSETDKQRIEEKVQDLLIDNQLQVKGGTGTSPSQP